MLIYLHYSLTGVVEIEMQIFKILQQQISSFRKKSETSREYSSLNDFLDSPNSPKSEISNHNAPINHSYARIEVPILNFTDNELPGPDIESPKSSKSIETIWTTKFNDWRLEIFSSSKVTNAQTNGKVYEASSSLGARFRSVISYFTNGGNIPTHSPRDDSDHDINFLM